MITFTFPARLLGVKLILRYPCGAGLLEEFPPPLEVVLGKPPSSPAVGAGIARNFEMD
jgi:hypothetical protein